VYKRQRGLGDVYKRQLPAYPVGLPITKPPFTIYFGSIRIP
jgi:hypothetical protein